MQFGCTVAELQSRMPYTEFLDWLAFVSIEPLPQERADLRHAQLLATLVNVNRDPKRPPVKAADFLVDWWKTPPTTESVRDKFKAIADRINAVNAAKAEHAND